MDENTTHLLRKERSERRASRRARRWAGKDATQSLPTGLGTGSRKWTFWNSIVSLMRSNRIGASIPDLSQAIVLNNKLLISRRESWSWFLPTYYVTMCQSQFTEDTACSSRLRGLYVYLIKWRAAAPSLRIYGTSTWRRHWSISNRLVCRQRTVAHHIYLEQCTYCTSISISVFIGLKTARIFLLKRSGHDCNARLSKKNLNIQVKSLDIKWFVPCYIALVYIARMKNVVIHVYSA
jgi:hypothetical protein